MKRLFILSIVAIVFFQCNSTEQKATKIQQQAQALEQQGKVIEALKLYDSLMQYEDTQVFASVKSELLKKGFSIGSCLTSWTIQKMTQLENKILAHYKSSNQLPTQEDIGNHIDAWGSEFKFTLEPTPKALFQILSIGPDSVKGTQDDILMAYKENRNSQVPRNKTNKNIDGEIILELDELRNSLNSTNGEIKTTLEALNRLNADTAVVAEQKVSLEELRNNLD